jgi:hypothetical protein
MKLFLEEASLARRHYTIMEEVTDIGEHSSLFSGTLQLYKTR